MFRACFDECDLLYYLKYMARPRPQGVNMTVKMMTADVAHDMPSHVQARDSKEFESASMIASDDATLNREIADAQKNTVKRDGRKMMQRIARMSGHLNQPNTETRHEIERRERDAAVRASLGTIETEEVSSKISAPVKRRPISSTVRFLAEMIGVGEAAVVWNALTMNLPTKSLLKMAKEAKNSFNPSATWGALVDDLQPRHPSCMRAARREIYIDEHTARQPSPIGMRMQPKANNLEASKEWMNKAETGELDNRHTHCELTGASLVDRGIRAGLSYWTLVPDYHGMGIDAAREMVNVAAILAGIMPGEIRGEVPSIAKQLAEDGNAWCGLAMATKHPIFYPVAKSMSKMRDSEFWNVEEEINFRNLNEWHKAVVEAPAAT